jgi:hypothetical protein
VRALGTGGLNPYATLNQLGIGGTSDYGSLGLNPYAAAVLKRIQRGEKSPAGILAHSAEDVVRGLPPVRLVFPQKPSKLYPHRGHRSEILSQLGVPIKEYDPREAAKQAKEGR